MMKTSRLYRLQSSVFLIVVFVGFLMSCVSTQVAPESQDEALLKAATKKDNAAQVKSLLAKGARVDLKTKKGETALSVARFEHIEQRLKAAGAK